MSGVIATSALIALVLTFGFRYLLHVIQRLRSIEEMKDDFTNNMTHELKTPIAIAYAANDSLLQFPDPTDEERTKKYLTAALEQLTKLTGLVESILAMSMERRKHLTMQTEKVSLKTFLTSVIEQQKLKAGKPCDIALECPDDAAVEADPTHFSNVIGNLIDNSIKYSGDSVSILIKADANSLSVSDNGIGIPEKALPEIFNKFYRVPHGNRSDVRGYGIGLFYVKSIIDKHGWSIDVTSRLNKGSRFTITFSRQ
ncbi:MAG: HAMP domain-containing histidine kinase [Muribaculaceae bacterium]|nr:HAMP domain-containing histidine kinase [Muribaculaceae bacterium]